MGLCAGFYAAVDVGQGLFDVRAFCVHSLRAEKNPAGRTGRVSKGLAPHREEDGQAIALVCPAGYKTVHPTTQPFNGDPLIREVVGR